MRDLFRKSEIGMIVSQYIRDHGHEIINRGYPQLDTMMVKDKEGNLLIAKLKIEQFNGEREEV